MTAIKDIASKVVLIKSEKNRKDLLQYIDSLLELENKGDTHTWAEIVGSLKGKVKIHDNFNEPIEYFKAESSKRIF